jgi:DNA polymerase-3 subunit beta
MNIECDKTLLSDAIGKADKITNKNVSLPVLSCVLIEAQDQNLIIKATNLDLGLEIKIPAKIKKTGKIAIQGSLLNQFLINLPSNDLQISLIQNEEGNLKILSKTSETLVKVLNSEDFPIIPKPEKIETIKILNKDFILGIKSVWYSASQSTIKPELSSVYLYKAGQDFVFVSTDSFRLAEKRVFCKTDKDFIGMIIPIKNAGDILKIFDGVDGTIDFGYEKNQFFIQNKEIYLVSRITDGNFPDYKQIIPKEDITHVEITKENFSQILKIAGLFSDQFNQVNIKVSKDNFIEVTSKNSDKGESKNSAKVSVEGDEVIANFNQRYLLDCLSSIEEENLYLGFNGTNKPLIIRGSKNSSFFYLVMPMNK